MACLNGECGNGTYTGTAVDNLVTLVAPLVNKGLPLVQIMRGGSLGLADFLFEKKLVVDEGTGDSAVVYKFKDGLGANSKFQRVKTNADCQLEWREQLYTKPSAKLVSVAASPDQNKITVDDIKGLRGIGAGSSVIFKQANGKLVRVAVTSVAANVITLATGTVVTATAGTCIYRGPYAITNECGAEVNNKYELRQSVKYVSNFTRINLSLEFNTCDLSLDRLVDYLNNSETGAQDFVSEFQQAAIEGFVQEFQYKFWTDRNLKSGEDLDGNTVDSRDINETMGVIPALQRAQNTQDINLVVDHSICCDSEDTCAGDAAMVASFFANIRTAWKSGFYPKKVITIVGNQKFEENVQIMQAAFQEVNGISIVYNTDGKSNYNVSQGMPVINLGGITVQFTYDETLDTLFGDESIYFIVPTDYIYFKQRKFGYLDSNMKVTNEINGFIQTGFPWLRFIDISEDIDKFGRCKKYVSDFEYAQALAGMELGAWRVGKNFGPCSEACDLCSEEAKIELM